MVKQFCILFNFNLCCINLVIGCVVLYRGVDFVMLQGTLVFLVGDGEVVVVKRSGVVGYYVVICYGCSYIMCYMYLCKILVKLGQKVKCGDCIVFFGNIGCLIGLYLYYEVWINQQVVNLLMVKLLCIEGLIGFDCCEFLVQVKEIVLQLWFD